MRPEELLSPNVIKDVASADRGVAERAPWQLMSPSLLRDVVSLLDAAVVFVCSYLAKVLYIDILIGSGIVDDYLTVGLLAGAICFWSIKSYREEQDHFALLPTRRIARGVLIGFAAVLALGAALKLTGVYSRGWMLTWLVLSVGAIVIKDRLSLIVLGVLGGRGIVGRQVAIYGSGPRAFALKAALENATGSQTNCYVYDDAGQAGLACGIVRGDMQRLMMDGLSSRLERIVICLPPERSGEVANLVEHVSFLPVEIQVVAENMDWAGAAPRLSRQQGHYLVSVAQAPMQQWGGVSKRIMDLTGASIITLIVAPLLAVIALAVRLERRGPVLTTHRRQGYNHQAIDVFAFRVESQGAGDQGTGTRALTRVGSFLRMMRLENLPRLINVLNGDMSLVGPRPHALAHNFHCNEVVAKHINRHKVKPGMTGWAQVHGFRDSEADPARMADQAAADIHYMDNWSLWLDLQILALAPFLLIFGRADARPVRLMARVLGIGHVDFGPARELVSRTMAGMTKLDLGPNEFQVEGVRVSTVSVAAAARQIAETCREDRSRTIFTLNLDHVVKLRVDEAFHSAYRQADLVLADGFPIVWAGRLLGRNLNRAAGADLIEPLCAEAAARRQRVFLLGSTYDVLSNAARILSTRYPGMEVCGVYAPAQGFNAQSVEASECFEMLRAAKPHLCFIALGAPKQEMLAARAREIVPGTTFVCIGGGLDFITGAQVRAPRLVQALSLEWLWRMLSNPRRLAGRYLKCLQVVPSFFLRTLGGPQQRIR